MRPPQTHCVHLLLVLSGYLNCPVVYYNHLTEEVVSTDRQQPVPSYLDADLFIASHPHFIVQAYGNICGTLVLSSVDGGTEYVDDAFNAVTIDYTVSMLGLLQQKNFPSRFRSSSWKQQLVEDLLNNSSDIQKGHLRRCGHLCGFDFYRPTRIVLIESIHHHRENTNLIKQWIDHEISHPFSVFSVPHSAQLLVFISGASEEQLKTFCSEISILCQGYQISVLQGISDPTQTPADYQLAYHQAKQAIDIGQHFFDTHIYYYSEMALQFFLYENRCSPYANAIISKALGPIIDYDAHHASYPLLPTLSAIAKCGFNLTQAADMLYIHYNTLKYRYSRICEICHSNLTDYSTQLKISIALYLLKAQDRDDCSP